MSRLILDALRVREAEGRPILTGVIGAGSFGAGVVAQLTQAPGMVAAAVADLDPEAGLSTKPCCQRRGAAKGVADQLPRAQAAA